MFTGRKIYQRLLKIYTNSGKPVIVDGKPIIKENDPSDPDYIPPVLDPKECGESPIPPPDTTTTSSTTTTTNAPLPPPLDCNLLITTYGMDCNNLLTNRIKFVVGLPVTSITVEVHYNNNIINVFEDIPVFNGEAYFLLPKSVIGLVTFVVRALSCNRTYVFNIACPTTTTSTSTTTNTTSTTTTSTTSSTTTTTLATTTTTTTTTTSSTTTTTSGTPTSSTTTSTASNCNAVFAIDMTTACDGSNNYAVLLTKLSGTATNIEYGYSLTNNILNVVAWQSSSFLSLPGNGTTKYIFVRYNTGFSCTQFIATSNINCTGSTSSTSSTSTTTNSGCAGSVLINSVGAVSNTQLNAVLTSGLSSFNWKVKQSGTTVDSGSQTLLTNPQVVNLGSILLGIGITYEFFTYGNFCSDGVGTSFVWNPASTTTTTTTTSSSTTTTLPGTTTTTTSSTTTTTVASGCAGGVPDWRYNGQAGTEIPYASFEDAESAACFAGLGCTGYLSSAIMGATFYTDRTIQSGCDPGPCIVLPTGYYWIYPLADVDDVYVVHVTSGVIDQISANPCA